MPWIIPPILPRMTALFTHPLTQRTRETGTLRRIATLCACLAGATSPALLASTAHAQTTPSHFAEACTALTGTQMAGRIITRASIVQGDFTGGDTVYHDLPRFCRAESRIIRQDGDHIGLELWLPEAWNGRYLQAGNGGYAGSIAYRGLVVGLHDGFAVANSDGGHQSAEGAMSWAVGHPHRLADFGHLALHDTAIFAKEAVSRFYGHSPNHAYFSGCSDGGREALMSLQRYPEQFDGWLVGAPENDFIREQTTDLVLSQQSRGALGTLTAAQLALLTKQGLKSCAAQESTKLGFIADPEACHVDLKPLECHAGSAATCLNPAQITAIRQAWAGFTGPLPGSTTLYHTHGIAYSIGAEDAKGSWGTWLSHVAGNRIGWHESFAQPFFADFVYNKPGMDITTIDPADAWQRATTLASADTDALDTNLARQRAAGKKIIQYHGWSDIGIPMQLSLDYYSAVQNRLGGPVTDFYRLFLVPGVGHCGGGPGPSAFGHSGDLTTPFDPDRNMLAALVRWVEQGKAPTQVIARHEDAPIFERPVCVFPAKARYNGHGDPAQASSFHCQ